MFIKRLMVEGASLVWSVEQNQVPGERSLDPDLRRFKVADLADQD